MIQRLTKLIFQLRCKLKKYKNRIFFFVTSCSLITILLFSIWDFNSIKVPIFGFHDIYSPGSSSYTSTAPYLDYKASDLELFIVGLIKENYWFLSSQDIDNYFISRRFEIPKEFKGKRAIALSFDDAYESVHTHVLPILERVESEHGIKIPIILFLNSKRMMDDYAKRPQKAHYLTCDAIRVGFEKGFYDLQSAGHGHRLLTKDDQQTIANDVITMQNWLKNCVGNLAQAHSVGQHFAYPYNRVNSQVRQVVSQYHQTAYRYDRRLQRMGWSTRRYSISRLGVDRKTSLSWMFWQAHRASRLMVL
jgi:poly-beta-1,6-N-acetyl-D-glucosamine N-deacetylase